MPESILVTGATGSVGSRLVKRLVESGNARVLAGTRSPAKAANLAALGAHVVEFDFDKPETVERAVAEAEKIFLLTPGGLSLIPQANSVLAAAMATGVKHIVRLSVLGAELEPGILLTRLHRGVENGVVSSEINYTFLRPNGFMQNYEQYAAGIKAQNMFSLPMGDAKVSFVDAWDIAAVAAVVLLEDSDEYYGKMYDITGGEALGNVQIADILSSVLGRRIQYDAVSDQDARQAMQTAGLPAPMTDALIELYALYRTGEAAVVSGAVRTLTGHDPTTFEEYARNNRSKFE